MHKLIDLSIAISSVLVCLFIYNLLLFLDGWLGWDLGYKSGSPNLPHMVYGGFALVIGFFIAYILNLKTLYRLANDTSEMAN